MTDNDVALGFIKEGLTELKTTMHDEIAGIRLDMAKLSTDVRAHLADQVPRVSVIEHRLSEAEKDIQANAESRKDNRALWLTVLVAVSAWVPDVLGWVGK